MTATRRILAACVLAIVSASGCTGGDASDEAFCRRLSEPPPSEDRWEDADLIVFVEPDAAADDETAVRASLDADDEIDSYTWVDQQEAYDEFVELFAASPEMVAAVGPEKMPPSARIVAHGDDPETVQAVGRRLQSLPGVYRVVYRSEVEQSVIDASVRPLTSELAQHMSAFTRGRSSIQLAEVAPEEVRDSALVLDRFWARPTLEGGAGDEQVTAAARQVAAYYDTECP